MTTTPPDASAAPPKEPTPGIDRTALEAAQLNGNIKGKVYVITGAYSGIGVETTKALLHEGGKVVVGGRNPKLLEEFVAKMKEEYSSDAVDGSVIDLGDLASVQAFAKYVNDKYDTVDVLINNAGVMNTPAGVTKDGIETQMGVNVVGHFLLAKSLVTKTKRQVWVSSLGHTMHKSPRVNIDYIKSFSKENMEPYDGWKSYQQSKLGDILIAKEFDRRYSNVEAASLHPGGIQTNLNRHTGFFSTVWFVLTRAPELMRNGGSGGFKMKTPEAGASTTVTAATLPADKFVQGGYYDNCEIGNESESAKNEEDAKALFDYCDELTKEFQ